MFEHLVESGSHSEDVARKGSFILITLAVYLVLIVAGVHCRNHVCHRQASTSRRLS